MTFLRNSALLLPAGFLAAAFVFLVTHGPQDPALAVYPFVSEWFGADRLPRSPEVSFFVQSLVLFALPYLGWLILVFVVALAERAIFGRDRRTRGELAIVFSRCAAGFLLLIAAAIGGSTRALQRRLKSEAPVGAAAVAAAPFVAGAVAPIPALIVSIPLAGFLRMKR